MINNLTKILSLLFALIVVANISAKDSDKLDSMLIELPKSQEDTAKVKLLNQISHYYYNVNPDSAMKYANKAVQLAKQINWEHGLAEAYNNMGVSNSMNGNNKLAESYFQKALELYIKHDEKSNISQQYGNLGIIAMSMSNFPDALEYYQKALKIDEKINNEDGVARQLGNIGLIYTNLSDYKQALDYNKRALKLYEKSDNKEKMSKQLGNIALNYTFLGNQEKALEYYKRALAIDENIGNKKGMAIRFGNIGILYRDTYDYEKSLEYYEKALAINREIGSKIGAAINLGNIGEYYYRISQDSVIARLQANGSKINLNKNANLIKAIEYTDSAKSIAQEIGAKRQLIEYYHILDEAYKSRNDYKKAHEYRGKWAELKDSIFSVEKTAEIANLEARKENELKEKALKVKDLELLKKESEQTKLFIGIGAIAFVLVLIIFQRRKSEKLLLNILPAKIAKRLKRNEKNIADRFDEASIIFIDIVGFTEYSKGTEPELVVTALNDIFTRFDILAKKHGLEKIKTIGDCYMAVAGLPEENKNHAIATAKFALEVKDIMHNYNTPDGKKLKFRIGIDSGPVIAGIIGKSKFSYDLWGAAVNMASRMESTGLPDEIQVTENFIDYIKDSGLRYKERGSVDIKGKGQVTTYLLS